jgi:hypothetical protein
VKAAALLAMASCAFGQLAGTVRDSVSKLPVAGVRIHATQTTVESSATGEFALDGLKPGKYVLFFNREGYEDGRAAVEVTPDGNPVTLELKPWAELSGVIRGEDGHPLEGVALYLAGHRYTTDNDGRYDALDIPGSQYALTIRLPFALRRKTAVKDAARGETFGYPNTLFYPGELDRKLAAAVTLAPGAHMTNFDIDLRRGPLAQMKGKIVDAPANAQVELDSPNGLPEGPYGKQALDEHGGFHFDLLEPGDYTVVVHRNKPGDDLPYFAPVHLGEAGVQNLEVVLPPFARIEGVARASRADLRWAGTLRVMLGRQGYDTEVRVGPDGRFAMNAIPPGEWHLTIDTSLSYRADDPNRRLYLNAAPARTLRVAEGGNLPLELTLTDESARITGTVDEPGMVTVTHVGDGPSSSRVAVPRPDGSFELSVEPGDYRVSLSGSANCARLGEDVTVQSGAGTSVHLKACGSAGN